MSAKKGDLNLLIPGADGWEIWTGSTVNGFQRHAETEHKLALDVTGVPSGSVAMAVPVRQISAVPFRAQTDDLSLLGDLAVMQLEKNGTRPALDGGQLTDYFIYGTAPEETHLTAIVMNPPSEGQLPRKSPESFDISPRCLPLPDGKVVVWRELGRWVFAIGKPGHALYFQCLSSDRLDARAGNEIRLALTQLEMQGLLKVLPDSVVVWSHGSSSDARPEELEFLARGLDVPVESSPRPVPTWPAPPSRLLPADVRAERLAVRGKRNRNILIAALLVVYLGIVAFLYFDLQKAKEAATLATKDANSISGDADLLLTHRVKWDELRPVVETEFQPFEVFLASYRALPNTKQERFIRITKASFTNQFREIDGDLKVSREVVLEGQAEREAQQEIPKFAGNLRSSRELEAFRWAFPPESEDKRSGKVTFNYTGNATE
ncbi:MAG: hypothetical protein ACJAVK_002614 [Akkermansiaceae bacterium]|jgi:hypothetical protein